MAKRKITGKPELDSILNSIGKKFSQEVIDRTIYESQGAISTGSIKLDKATKIGGVPRGRIIEVFGESGGGKTSLCFSILAQAQKARIGTEDEDRWDIVIDLEHTITGDFMRGFGVDTDRVLHLRPMTAEAALQIVRDAPKSGDVDIVIFDSIAAGQTLKHTQRDIGQADVGGIAKLMHDTLRSVSKTSERTRTTYLFINQITYKIGVMFGNPETTPGGVAMPFYASMRLKAMKGKASPKGPDTMHMRIKMAKTKVGVPYGTDAVDIHFRYGKGVDHPGEIIEMAKEMGYLRNTVGVTGICLDGTGNFKPVGPDCEKGKVAGEQYVRDHPEILQELTEKILHG